MRVPRPVTATVVVLAVLGGCVVAAEAVSTSRIEADLSRRIAADKPVGGPPSVTIGGAPGSRWSGPGTLRSVAVRVEGVERPGLAPVAVEADATDVRVPEDPDAPPTARDVTVSVKITGHSLGPALGLRDVLVGAADDPTLAGGTEDRARVTGTVEGTDVRLSAIVDLVVDARGAHLVPDDPDDPRLRRLALTLAPDLLPLGVPVTTLSVTGGTVTASGTGGAATAPLDGLAAPGL